MCVCFKNFDSSLAVTILWGRRESHKVSMVWHLFKGGLNSEKCQKILIMRYFNSVQIVKMVKFMIKQLHNLAPEDEFISESQCTVLSDGNVIQKHWKSSFHSFSFSVYAESWQLFLWTSFSFLLVPLSFLPSFHCPSLSFSSPLSFLPFFFFWCHFFFCLSLSLFIVLDFVLLNMNYLRAIATGVRYMHMALYLMLPTVLIRLHLLKKSVLKFYLRIKPHVVIRVLNLFWQEKEKSPPGLFLYCLSPLCYFTYFLL